MPAKFENLGISFQYPDNWTLDDSDAIAGGNAVTVYSPGGVFWTVAVHPRSADPLELADGVVTAMREEYKEIETDEIRETVLGRELVGYDLSFYYLDFVNSAQVRSLKTPTNTYTIFCQGEDREFERLRRVLQAMTISLLSGLKAEE
jgi:hypothetical protein